MSEPKHTPGPWRQRDDPADWLIEGADGALLAKAYTNVMAAGANAQLIAAAPELAEALRRFVLAVSVSACPDCGAEPGVNIDCELCMATSAAETALEKAGLR